MDLTDYLVFFVIAWVIIQVGRGVIDSMEISVMTKKLRVLKHLDDIIHQVKIEKLGDVEYWYDEHDYEFLGQGKTFEEVVDHIKGRFPSHIFVIPEKGGVAAKTNWQLMPHEDFKKIKFEGEI
jgi:hypothetical protein